MPGKAFLSLWVPVIVYMAVIFFLSSLPEAPLPPQLSDKSGHSIGYLGLAIVVTRALAGGLPRRVRVLTACAAVALCVAYGVSDEFHQSFVPGRSADVHDLYADATGALLGTAACWAWGILSIRSDV